MKMPCFRPGCKGKPILKSWVKGGDYTRYYVECSACGLHTYTDAGSELQAWDDWNRRGKDSVLSGVGYLASLIEGKEKEIRGIVIRKLIEELEAMK